VASSDVDTAEVPVVADAGSRRAGRAGHPVRRWVLRTVAVVVVASIAYVGVTFALVWRASGRDEARPAGAIVVLGAAQYDGRPSPALAARLDHAFELWEDGLAPVIVVTGGRQEGDRFTEATAGYNDLRDRGVPDDALRLEVQGHSTYESLAATSRFLRREGIDDVILVSGPAHSARLSGIADDLGLDAVVSPADGSPSLRSLARETAAVSLGQLVGYRRLERFDA
jgi:vancomycin permeability regulator SanA